MSREAFEVWWGTKYQSHSAEEDDAWAAWQAARAAALEEAEAATRELKAAYENACAHRVAICQRLEAAEGLLLECRTDWARSPDPAGEHWIARIDAHLAKESA